MKAIDLDFRSGMDFAPNEHRPGGGRFMWLCSSYTLIGEYLRGHRLIGMPKNFDVCLIRVVENPWHKNIHTLVWSSELPDVRSEDDAPVFHTAWSDKKKCFEIIPHGLAYKFYLKRLEELDHSKLEIIS